MKQCFGESWRCRRLEPLHPENNGSNSWHGEMEVVGQLQSRQGEGKIQFGGVSTKQISWANKILLQHLFRLGLNGP